MDRFRTAFRNTTATTKQRFALLQRLLSIFFPLAAAVLALAIVCLAAKVVEAIHRDRFLGLALSFPNNSTHFLTDSPTGSGLTYARGWALLGAGILITLGELLVLALLWLQTRRDAGEQDGIAARAGANPYRIFAGLSIIVLEILGLAVTIPIAVYVSLGYPGTTPFDEDSLAKYDTNPAHWFDSFSWTCALCPLINDRGLHAEVALLCRRGLAAMKLVDVLVAVQAAALIAHGWAWWSARKRAERQMETWEKVSLDAGEE